MDGKVKIHVTIFTDLQVAVENKGNGNSMNSILLMAHISISPIMANTCKLIK
uniref:Uncharacterized protein n=1 Tax=Rhizophora mucronata TaxID=61149 RepID=A0A2P2Q4T3_RHIMU